MAYRAARPLLIRQAGIDLIATVIPDHSGLCQPSISNRLADSRLRLALQAMPAPMLCVSRGCQSRHGLHEPISDRAGCSAARTRAACTGRRPA